MSLIYGIPTVEYTFPSIIPVDEELPDKFGVKYYPTTIIINEDGYVVFFGSIDYFGQTGPPISEQSRPVIPDESRPLFQWATWR